MQNFVVYKSSAGSGKTFTLVKEYLRLSLSDEKKLITNYKRILAVTFTNKAAAEMKQRILDALNQIANQPKMVFVGELLCSELRIKEEELRKRAKIVLSQILHHYSDFSIGTIDSFTHKIVKTFAHDLKLPVNFNLEMDVEGFYDKVISSLFSQIGEDEYVSKLLKEFVLTKAEENASWDPEKTIKEFAKLLQKENSDTYLNQLKLLNTLELEEIRKELFAYISYYNSFLKTEGQKAISLILKNGLSDSDFTHKLHGPQSFFKKCINQTVEIETTIKGRVIDAIEKNQWADKKGDNKNKVEEIIPELNALAKSLIDFIKENHSYYSLCKLLSTQIYPLLLLKKIEEISSEKKQEERLVFISEFNKNIFELINNEPTPFIYERLGEKYQHYLLDEFQDTSTLQWHNILPLIDNSLSSGWYNLIVGDGKQSIYRWRNANVQQFIDLPKIENTSNNFLVEERSDNLKRNFTENLLNTNFRSLKTIIDFNNDLFDKLNIEHLTDVHKKIYHNQQQNIKHAGTGLITVNTGKINKDDIDVLNFKLVKDYIQNARNSNFDYRDICIIVRKNTDGNNIANYLLENKIPIISSDSLLLKNNLEINTIVAYLNYLSNNQDKVSATAVLNYLLQSKQITNKEFTSSAKKLAKNSTLFEVLKSFNIELPNENLSLNNLFDHCLIIINALSLNKNGYTYCRFFLDEVNEYLITKNSNIASFCEWWKTRSNKASLIIPANTNAVKIMTIHASKGLEFPVVIIPYCNWNYYKANDNWVNITNQKVKLPVAAINFTSSVKDAGFEKEYHLEEQEQILENLNLLYVAFTRAVERLHIISAHSSPRKTLVCNWLDKYLIPNYAEKEPNYFEIGQSNNKQIQTDKIDLNQYNLNPLKFETSTDVVQIKAAYLMNSEDALEAKEMGIIIHSILSKITHKLQVDEAVNSALIDGIINQSQIISIKEKLNKLVNHPELLNYFLPEKNYKIEAEMATFSGEVLRPDRIVIEDNATIIIDYKTGKQNNKKYFKQLLKYQEALENMGYINVKSLLVYIEDLAIIELN
ncbi:MAG: UvrD-helicase domain-containing protein [Bacteroidota bacterium]|nr:UvrD-helicase domain-containing protein [Bacteroidota bacterium]MDP3146219.1 UvrD-helicase domain-containing protein [Bacteroidota bacterium]